MADPNPQYACIQQPVWQLFDNNGDPASGYSLYTYRAGTTTPATTYQTPTGTEHANPITLNSRGEVANNDGEAKPIFGNFTNYNYKFVLVEPDGSVEEPVWTMDNIKVPFPSDFIHTLLDDTAAATARATLGLGSAATKTAGVANGNVPVMDSTGYPAADGSQITNLSAANIDSLPLPRGHIGGLTLSGSALDLSIAVGECVMNADDGGHTAMRITSAMTKKLSTTWVVGSGEGGMDNGSASNDWYHVYVIRRSDTGVVDVVVSNSSTWAGVNKTKIPDYDAGRRIGSIKVDSDPKIVAFTQVGDTFWWSEEKGETLSTVGTSESLITLAYVPDGVRVDAIINANIYDADKAPHVTLNSGDVPTTGLNDPDNSPSSAHGNLYTDAADRGSCGRFVLMTNASGQIRARSEDAGTQLYMWVQGYIDRRGRDD